MSPDAPSGPGGRTGEPAPECAARVDQRGAFGPTSPRGTLRAPLRVSPIEPGTVFIPFHYAGSGQANLLTMTVWDPVSKQPTFKTAVCRVVRAD